MPIELLPADLLAAADWSTEQRSCFSIAQWPSPGHGCGLELHWLEPGARGLVAWPATALVAFNLFSPSCRCGSLGDGVRGPARSGNGRAARPGSQGPGESLAMVGVAEAIAALLQPSGVLS